MDSVWGGFDLSIIVQFLELLIIGSLAYFTYRIQKRIDKRDGLRLRLQNIEKYNDYFLSVVGVISVIDRIGFIPIEIYDDYMKKFRNSLLLFANKERDVFFLLNDLFFEFQTLTVWDTLNEHNIGLAKSLLRINELSEEERNERKAEIIAQIHAKQQFVSDTMQKYINVVEDIPRTGKFIPFDKIIGGHEA